MDDDDSPLEEGKSFGEEPGVLAAAVAGDGRALERLLACIGGELTAYCVRRLGQRGDRLLGVEDVVQEILTAVALALPRYEPGRGRFRSFVYGIAQHKINDAFRTEQRDRRIVATSFDTGAVAEPADPGPDPVELAQRREQAEQAKALLAMLPERQQLILFMRLVQRQTADEVGALLVMSPGAVRVTQHRALMTLRRKITDSVSRTETQAGSPDSSPR